MSHEVAHVYGPNEGLIGFVEYDGAVGILWRRIAKDVQDLQKYGHWRTGYNAHASCTCSKPATPAWVKPYEWTKPQDRWDVAICLTCMCIRGGRISYNAPEDHAWRDIVKACGFSFSQRTEGEGWAYRLVYTLDPLPEDASDEDKARYALVMKLCREEIAEDWW